MTDDVRRTARMQLVSAYRRLADEAASAAAHYTDPHSGDPQSVPNRVNGHVSAVQHAHRMHEAARTAARRRPAARSARP